MTVQNVADMIARLETELRQNLPESTSDEARLAVSIYASEMRRLVHRVIVDLGHEHTAELMALTDRLAEKFSAILTRLSSEMVRADLTSVAIRDKPCT